MRSVVPHNTAPFAKTSVTATLGSTKSLKPSASSTTQPRSPTGVAEVVIGTLSKRTSAQRERAANSFGITSRGNQPRRREPRASSTATSACVVTRTSFGCRPAARADKVPSKVRACPSCTTARSNASPPCERVKQYRKQAAAGRWGDASGLAWGAWRSAITAAATWAQTSAWLEQLQDQSLSSGHKVTVGEIIPLRVEILSITSSLVAWSTTTPPPRLNSTPRDQSPGEHA